MSETVAVTTQTISTSTTAFGINIPYLKTWTGILQLFHLALGIVCVSILGGQYSYYGHYENTTQLIFILFTTTCLIASSILFLNYMLTASMSPIFSKSTYELVYHIIAFGMLLCAALSMMSYAGEWKDFGDSELLWGAAICGLVNALLYLCSSIIALHTLRQLWAEEKSFTMQEES